MEPDFSGYATKAGIKCTDGLTILPGAFAHQDQTKVPLVYQHGHTDVENVLGHVTMTNKQDGVWVDAFFNKSAKAQHAREAVINKDITMMSIWANNLNTQAQRVIHGVIREVSLVLSGANPDAKIEPLSIRHSDGEEELVEGEAIITTGLAFAAHASGDTSSQDTTDDNVTVAEVVDSMDEDQQKALYFLVASAVAEDNQSSEEHQNTGKTGEEDETIMHHNAFENNGKGSGQSAKAPNVISHDDMAGIVRDAEQSGSLRLAVEAYATQHLEHGIEGIGALFPNAHELNQTPEWITRRSEWVSDVFGAARKSPFAKIKTRTADLTYDEARAKGYVTGDMKKDQYFTLSSRETTPKTVYKRQKIDRDDMIDITDFDVVVWLKSEMRMMLEEEIARAILISDGRAVDDDDKISETNIRPISKEDSFYAIPVSVPYSADDGNTQDVIDAVILSMEDYRGTGTPVFFTKRRFVARAKLLRDTTGRKLYPTEADLASELGVSKIVVVEPMNAETDLIGILVNMNDYVVGADKGGEVSLFDDFDIDYNQYKYLIEARMSGALAHPKSAIVLWMTAVDDTAVTVVAPTQNKTTWTVTLPATTGVVWVDADGDEVSGDVTLSAGEDIRVTATADDDYYLNPGKTEWTFMRPSGT